MPVTPPDRRVVLLTVVCGLVALAGCLGGSPSAGDTVSSTPAAPATTDAPEGPVDRSADLVYDGEFFDGRTETVREAATVTGANGSVVVTGLVYGVGDRACLTMDATASGHDNGTLVVRVTPGTDPPADRACNASAALYDYRVTVDVPETPDRVVVRYGGGFRVATTALDGRVLDGRSGTATERR